MSFCQVSVYFDSYKRNRHQAQVFHYVCFPVNHSFHHSPIIAISRSYLGVIWPGGKGIQPTGPMIGQREEANRNLWPNAMGGKSNPLQVEYISCPPDIARQSTARRTGAAPGRGVYRRKYAYGNSLQITSSSDEVNVRSLNRFSG